MKTGLYIMRRTVGASRSDSVLMEFVLVAPLYFLLLGGLFLVADLSVNKMRMQIGDELVTWVGASRFCPHGEDGGRDAGKVAELLVALFERSIGGTDAGFKVNAATDEALHLNDFMSCYSGGIVKLPVQVPGWVRGMMLLCGLMSGTSDPDSGWFNRSEIEMNCDFPRVFVFHRHALSGLDRDSDPSDPRSRDRAIPEREVVSGGYLGRVLDDDWIHLDEGNDEEGLFLIQPFPIPQRRYLGAFGE